MNMQKSAARAKDSARAPRSLNGTGSDLTVENARLGREVARLQALCGKHERTVFALTQALWRLREEVPATGLQVAQPSGGVQVGEEVEQSDGEIGVLAQRHRLGVPDARSYPIDPGALAAWAIDASDGRPR